MQLLRRLSFATAAACAFLFAAAPASPAPAPSYLTTSQRAQLRKLRLTVIAPLSIPDGFRLQSVHAQRGVGCGTCDDYTLVFADGNATVKFFGTNWTAGGDVDDDAFNAYFTSPIWGHGVVSVEHGVGVKNETCLTAYALDARRNTSFFLPYKKDYYDVQACSTNLAPADVARMIESAAIITP